MLVLCAAWRAEGESLTPMNLASVLYVPRGAWIRALTAIWRQSSKLAGMGNVTDIAPEKDTTKPVSALERPLTAAVLSTNLGVPIDLQILGGAPGRNDIEPAITVEVGEAHILSGHAVAVNKH